MPPRARDASPTGKETAPLARSATRRRIPHAPATAASTRFFKTVVGGALATGGRRRGAVTPVLGGGGGADRSAMATESVVSREADARKRAGPGKTRRERVFNATDARTRGGASALGRGVATRRAEERHLLAGAKSTEDGVVTKLSHQVKTKRSKCLTRSSRTGVISAP